MTQKNSLDSFGEHIVNNVVDSVLLLFQNDLSRSASTECNKAEIAQLLGKLNQGEVDLLQCIIKAAVVKSTHYFLWQAEHEEMKIIYKGEDMGDMSDGLCGELYLDDGWLAKYSKFFSV